LKHLLYERLDAALREYLSALREALPQSDPARKSTSNEPWRRD
jgi:hypothetical protein